MILVELHRLDQNLASTQPSSLKVENMYRWRTLPTWKILYIKSSVWEQFFSVLPLFMLFRSARTSCTTFAWSTRPSVRPQEFLLLLLLLFPKPNAFSESWVRLRKDSVGTISKKIPVENIRVWSDSPISDSASESGRNIKDKDHKTHSENWTSKLKWFILAKQLVS